VPLARIATVLLLACAVGLPASGRAETIDGHHLLQMCNNTLKILTGTAIDDEVTEAMMFDAGVCIGMIAGISRTLFTLGKRQEVRRPLACLPDRPMTNEQATRMILRYLEANRERMHRPGAELALDAFREAFPCRQ
jgi:hypothetical protein